MLGFFATSFKAYPLTFKYIGQAEAPQGKANVLEVTGDANFKIRFFVDINTNLPIMVSWMAPEHRLYFADYRGVDGIKLPFRLRRAPGTNTTEDNDVRPLSSQPEDRSPGTPR